MIFTNCFCLFPEKLHSLDVSEVVLETMANAVEEYLTNFLAQANQHVDYNRKMTQRRVSDICNLCFSCAEESC